MMSVLDKENIQRFFSTISPWEGAYAHGGVSYFAIEKDGVFNLVQARVFLRISPSAIPRTHVRTRHVLAGYFPISELNVCYRDLISQLTSSNELKTPAGKFVLPVDTDGRVAPNFVPFHQEGLRSGNRLPILSLSGARWHSFVQQPDIDWELKAASHPFDALNELLAEYSLGGYQNDLAIVEIVAQTVAEIVFSSRVEGEEAEPSAYLAKTLDARKCQIGYRVFLHGKVIERGSIGGNELVWSEQDQYMLGVGKLKIPRGAALHCVASYDGFAQHQGWIADPRNSQNPRRASLEEFDDKLEVLRDFLFEEQKPRRESRDFEFGVAWLMWMLGFSVAQAGGTSRTSDAADIIATTPKGHVLIVECTTRLLNAESKLAKLVERTEAVRRRVESTGHSHLKLLPVIVTAKSMDEVRADLEQAQKLGVTVVTKERLLELLSQTIVSVDADIIFDQAWEAIQPNQEQLGLFPGQ